MKKILLALSILSMLVLPAYSQSTIWNIDSPPPEEEAPETLYPASSSPAPLGGQQQSDFPKLFGGGGLSFGFGDVEYYDIQPMVGVQINPRLSSGVTFLYRYRKDKRYATTLTTNDYGATIFGRFHVNPAIFLHGEYEYLDYEYYRADLSKDRDNFSSFPAGAGVSQPLGKGGSAYATALYNFSYDQDDSPYDSAWVYRFGVSYGF